MPDIFDEIAAEGLGDTAVATAAPTVLSSGGMDIFDQIANESAPSDARGIANAGLTGLGGYLEFVDQLNPFDTRAMGADGNTGIAAAVPLKFPKLFGLSNYLGLSSNTEQPISQVFDAKLRNAGIKNDQQPETEYGKFLGNAAENAAANVGFGPVAMLVSAVLGGTGGYLGEKVDPEYGRVVGSTAFQLTPGVLTKTGAIKKATETLGPTLSELPVIGYLMRKAGAAPIESAVGRALAENATDVKGVTTKLDDINAVIGPKTQADALKAVDELTGDAGLARVTDAVDNAVPNAGIKLLGEERAAARLDDVQSLQPGAATSSANMFDLSKRAESAMARGIDEFETVVETPAWNAVDKAALLDTRAAGLDDALTAKIADITQDGALTLDGEAGALVSRFRKAQTATDEGVVNMAVVQQLRSKALELQRATRLGLNAADRATYKTASALEEHLRDIVDTNAKSGFMSAENATKWEKAREATALKFENLDPKRSGTKALQTLGRDEELANTKFIQEGLLNPDSLDKQLSAARVVGGKSTYEAVRGQYRLALLDRLKNTKHSKWAAEIADDRQVWEKVFTSDELARIANNADDAKQLAAVETRRMNSYSQGSNNSATATRQAVEKRVMSQKGIAGANNINLVVGAAGGVGGFQKGWDNGGDSYLGKLAAGIIGAGVGATVGQGYRNAAARASSSFDTLLVKALKDPRTAARVIKSAEPSKLRKLLGAAVVKSAAGGAMRVTGQGIGDMAKRVTGVQSPAIDTSTSDEQSTETAPMIDPKVSEFEGGQRLKAYPPPAAGSGVTVATGIDLGQRTKTELESLGVEKELIEKVSPYLGLRDADARKALKEKPLELSKSEADKLDDVISKDITKTVSEKYSAATGAALNALPQEARTVIESLAYNFGPNLDTKLPTIWKFITEGDWESLHAALLTTKWKQPKLAGRRAQEAALLEPLIRTA
jgi:hypothetical protein